MFLYMIMFIKEKINNNNNNNNHNSNNNNSIKWSSKTDRY